MQEMIYPDTILKILWGNISKPPKVVNFIVRFQIGTDMIRCLWPQKNKSSIFRSGPTEGTNGMRSSRLLSPSCFSSVRTPEFLLSVGLSETPILDERKIPKVPNPFLPPTRAVVAKKRKLNEEKRHCIRRKLESALGHFSNGGENYGRFFI